MSLHRPIFFVRQRTLTIPSRIPSPLPSLHRASRQPSSKPFSTTPLRSTTYNQVIRGCRIGQPARKPRSPALVDRPELKGVCIKVGFTKPKKPNSGERKTARVRLSSGKTVTAYIPGEGRCAKSDKESFEVWNEETEN
ncbi:MAG: 37S ribosomal protein S12, mitochondrial [Bogoriella megaspora]|nr:MAG: 37S ribosomal protein S12, mitochondrial [Bogoriella megaspora]